MPVKKKLAVTFDPDEYNVSAEPLGNALEKTDVAANGAQTATETDRAVEPGRRAPGRPLGRRTVGKDKGAGMTMYMTREMKGELRSCAFFAGVDQGDIIRTAIGVFLHSHSVDGRLDKEGIALVRKHIADTTE